MYKKFPNLMLIVVIVISGFYCSSINTNNDNIEVKLEKAIDVGPPYYGMSNIFFQKPTNDQFQFKPEWKDVEIAEVISGANCKDVFIVKFLDTNNSKKYIVDSNANLDFTDDYILEFESAKDIIYSNVPIQITSKSFNSKKIHTLNFQILVAESYGYSYARINEYRTGELIVDNKKYNILLRLNYRSNPFFDKSDGTNFLIDHNGDGEFNYNCTIDSNGTINYSDKRMLSSPFMINNKAFSIVNIDSSGSSLIIEPSSIKEGTSPGFRAPNIKTNDMSGNPFDLSSLKGNLTLIELWSTNCYWCEQLNPTLNEIYNRYKDDGYNWVAISKETDSSVVKSYLDSHPTDATVILNNDIIKSKYDSEAYPSFYLIDKDGKIILFEFGANFVKDLDKIIALYL